MTRFEKMEGYPSEIQGRFNSFITTQFDDSLSVEMQIRSLIKWINSSRDLVNNMVDYINLFIETFDERLQVEIVEHLNEWLDDGTLAKIINNDVFDMKADKTFVDSEIARLEGEINKNYQKLTTEMMNAVYLAGETSEIDFDVQTNNVPIYWRSHINSKIETINNLQKQAGRNAVSIGFITDIHYERNTKNYGKLLTEIDKKTNIQHIINGGDMLSERTTKPEFLRLMREAQSHFGNLLDKTYFTMGNHDDNSYQTNDNGNWSKLVDDKEQFSEYFRYLTGKTVMGESGKYYYVDDNNFKIRIIMLDSIDIPYIKEGNYAKYSGQNMWAYRQEQLEWFGNIALDVPDEDWSVMVFSHLQPYATGVTGATATIRNATIARKILQAFKNKTSYSGNSSANTEDDLKASVSVDFTNGGGNVIGWFSGHVHYDNMVDMPEGIKLITTLCDGWSPWADAPAKTRGTTTEQAFDILTINKKSRKVDLTRIGAGNNRSFTY